jgi:hypothetical protein
MKSVYPNHYNLLCQKGHYPYEWVDNIDKLQHKGLPPIENFYSSLRKEYKTQKEYEHAQHVYDALDCKQFQDYHEAYLKTDVLLMADVFEQFRKVCMNYYGLDPANYISAPSLAWDAMLLKTNIKLDLISDLEMLNFIEKQKRGGLCFLVQKDM